MDLTVCCSGLQGLRRELWTPPPAVLERTTEVFSQRLGSFIAAGCPCAGAEDLSCVGDGETRSACALCADVSAPSHLKGEQPRRCHALRRRCTFQILIRASAAAPAALLTFSSARVSSASTGVAYSIPPANSIQLSALLEPAAPGGEGKTA